MMSAWLFVISILTIIASALASAYVNVSRERLWLRASKAEELYRAVAMAYAAVSAHFVAHRDPAQDRYGPRDRGPIGAVLTDVQVSVALYFPDVKRELAQVEQGLTRFLHALDSADAASPADGAQGDLEVAIYELRDSVGLLKAAVLRSAAMQENWIAQTLRREPRLASHVMALAGSRRA